MPFASDKQRKYLYAKKPEVAKKLSKKHKKEQVQGFLQEQKLYV